MNKQLDMLDMLTIMSFVIAIMNLSLNKEQVVNLHRHLENQDEILIKEQNTMLKKIIEQNDEIIRLVKGGEIYAQEND